MSVKSCITTKIQKQVLMISLQMKLRIYSSSFRCKPLFRYNLYPTFRQRKIQNTATFFNKYIYQNIQYSVDTHGKGGIVLPPLPILPSCLTTRSSSRSDHRRFHRKILKTKFIKFKYI